MDQDRQERIRQRAHEIWESEGRPEGRDAHHWSQAEQELGEDSEKGGTSQGETSGSDSQSGEAGNAGDSQTGDDAQQTAAAKPAKAGRKTAGKSSAKAAKSGTGSTSESTPYLNDGP